MKEGNQRGDRFIDTKAHEKLISFKVTDGEGHRGLYRALNEAVKGMQLGDEAKFVISSDMAFGEQGLDMYFDPSMGFWKGSVAIIGTGMPNDPRSPASHHGRNPLCLAYVAIQPNTDIELKLDLMQINDHRRAIPETSCADCLCSAIMTGLGCNSTSHHY